jgi:heme-degrading monooxygenase HmoA
VYARLTLHTADPRQLGELISHYEEDVMGVFEHEPGNRGMSVLVNHDLGVVLVEAYWATDKDMRSNDATFVRPVHDAAFFGATVSIEHYEVARFVHVAPAPSGAAVTLTRLSAEPASMDDVVAAYGDAVAAPLTTSEGFCTAVLFLDRQSGRAAVQTTWRDAQASVAGRGAAAARRLAAVSTGTAAVRGIEEYRLDFHDVELD